MIPRGHVKRFAQFLKNNRFSATLWLGIALWLLFSYQRSFSQQGGGQNNNDGCTLGSDLQTEMLQSLGCLVSGPSSDIQAAGQASRIRFELNVGQADSGYGFVAHGREQSILLSSAEAVFHLRGSRQMKARTIRASLEGAQAGVEPEGEQPLTGHVNYLIGRDPKNWQTDIPTFGSVRF